MNKIFVGIGIFLFFYLVYRFFFSQDSVDTEFQEFLNKEEYKVKGRFE